MNVELHDSISKRQMPIFLGRKPIGEQQEKSAWSLLGCGDLQWWREGGGRDRQPKCCTDCVKVCRVARGLRCTTIKLITLCLSVTAS